MNAKPVFAALAAVALSMILALPAFAELTIVTPHGTWAAYPEPIALYQTQVQQPINADGSSNFKFNGKSVIPLKFALSKGAGPFLFESIFSNTPTADDFSFLNWQSSTPLTLADITRLSAVYLFTAGNCQAGSLRWTVWLNDGGTERYLDIHYQPGEFGISDQFCAPGTSGQNLIQSTDTIYVINQFTYPGSSYIFQSDYNTTYNDVVTNLGDLPVEAITLTVDSGYGEHGDQIVTLTSATVGTTTYTETFVPPPAAPLTPTCPTQAATIKVTKLSGTATGDVNEPISIQPNDINGNFRMVDCKYMYNLATSSLPGTGRYQVDVVIGGVTASGPALFDLR